MEDFSEAKVMGYFAKLSPSNQVKIMAQIILLLEAQRQDVDLN